MKINKQMYKLLKEVGNKMHCSHQINIKRMGMIRFANYLESLLIIVFLNFLITS